ncbi:MAG: VOC family protein [Bacteroidota bacterium]
MHLGHLDICLSVKDMRSSLAFYHGLGFKLVEGSGDSGYAIISKDGTRIGLYRNEPSMLNFRGSNLYDVVEYLRSNGMKDVPDVEVESDGSTGFTIKDPDGNLIYFNTAEGHDPDPN